MNQDGVPYTLIKQGSSLDISINYYIDIYYGVNVFDTIELDDNNKIHNEHKISFTYNYTIDIIDNNGT